ncbi:hypothetical protein F4781DRAFT_390644 [Annulohypoxylon bovei var. microspora]|nr:hypothetical protein F4781DRAFT_390644 [Annulohypoxylon bovei var. microspora]
MFFLLCTPFLLARKAGKLARRSDMIISLHYRYQYRYLLLSCVGRVRGTPKTWVPVVTGAFLRGNPQRTQFHFLM